MPESDHCLEGRVAIVTGGSRGIGRGIAERLGSAGATVVVAARTMNLHDNRGSATQTVELIKSRGGNGIALLLDLELPQSRQSLISETLKLFGRIDILVNNAGTGIYSATDKMPLSIAEGQIQSYFLGPWHLCHLVLPHMKANRRGWILNIGSCTAAMPRPPLQDFHASHGYEALYGALKAAIHRLSGGLAAELLADNIAVNVLAPVAGVFTPGLESLNLGLKADDAMFEPVEEIAEAAVDILCREPTEFTGREEYSYQFLDRIRRSTHTLDGTAIFTQR